MLKPDRFFDRGDSEISYYMGEVAEMGSIVCYPTGNVAVPGLDDAAAYAKLPALTSEKAIGMLMMNVVDKDLTETELNHAKGEVNIDNKVEIIRRGWFITNMLADSITPSPGDPAYFIAGGLFTTATGSEQVGTFESVVSAEGYARIRLNVS